jgi:prepilin-type N-terminal cleavage/methylation domain-containing protein
MKKMQKGFTLIELLVVIAIIGLLATIALASLNSARTKSADAAVKSNMANMLAQAEIYYDNLGAYSTADISSCLSDVFADPVITNQLTQSKASAATNATVNCSTGDTGQKWAAVVGPLKSSTTNYWCVDNSGNKKVVTTPSPTLGVCP